MDDYDWICTHGCTNRSNLEMETMEILMVFVNFRLNQIQNFPLDQENER